MASLNDVCFERIRDTFYYGMFGEFKLVVDKKTGCFNATKLCTDGGKQFKNWSRLEKSKRLIEYYESSRSDVSGYFYEVKGGNCNDTKAKTTGQYVCKELILDIASWVSATSAIESSSIFTLPNTKRNWMIIVSLLSRKMTRLTS
jgi:hypothetical protein